MLLIALLHFPHDLPELHRFSQPPVCPGRLRQREDAVDHRLQLAGKEVVAPQVTSRPRRASERTPFGPGGLATCSMTTSTPRRFVNLLDFLGIPSGTPRGARSSALAAALHP